MRSHLLAQAISGSKTAVKQLETYGWTKYLLQKQERIAARVKAVEPKTPIKLNNGKKHQ